MINITTNIQDVIKRFKALPGQINRAVLTTLDRANEEVVFMMQKEGAPVQGKLDWDSPEQQKAFFASDGFGEGIPYQRNHGYINAYQTRAIEGGVQIENVGHAALMIAGSPSGNILGSKVTASGQSHLFAGRWQPIKPVLAYVFSKLPEKLLQALHIEVSH